MISNALCQLISILIMWICSRNKPEGGGLSFRNFRHNNQEGKRKREIPVGIF